MQNPIPFEVGKCYKTKSGHAVKVVHIMGFNVEKPVVGILSGVDWEETVEVWSLSGSYLTGRESALDLAPVVGPDYEAMAKRLAIALNNLRENVCRRTAEAADEALAEAHSAGLIP